MWLLLRMLAAPAGSRFLHSIYVHACYMEEAAHISEQSLSSSQVHVPSGAYLCKAL